MALVHPAILTQIGRYFTPIATLPDTGQDAQTTFLRDSGQEVTMASSTGRGQGFCHFLALPREIRDMIYSFVFHSCCKNSDLIRMEYSYGEEIIAGRTRKTLHPAKWTPNDARLQFHRKSFNLCTRLFLVNMQIYQESRDRFYNSFYANPRLFRFDSMSEIQGFSNVAKRHPDFDGYLYTVINLKSDINQTELRKFMHVLNSFLSAAGGPVVQLPAVSNDITKDSNAAFDTVVKILVDKLDSFAMQENDVIPKEVDEWTRIEHSLGWRVALRLTKCALNRWYVGIGGHIGFIRSLWENVERYDEIEEEYRNLDDGMPAWLRDIEL